MYNFKIIQTLYLILILASTSFYVNFEQVTPSIINFLKQIFFYIWIFLKANNRSVFFKNPPKNIVTKKSLTFKKCISQETNEWREWYISIILKMKFPNAFSCEFTPKFLHFTCSKTGFEVFKTSSSVYLYSS